MKKSIVKNTVEMSQELNFTNHDYGCLTVLIVIELHFLNNFYLYIGMI